MLGLAKLRGLKTDADDNIQRFLQSFKGENYIKDAYQKLAWHSLVHDDLDGYRDNMTLCKDNGTTTIDDDKQAQKEAENGKVPNVVLLRARLLFDGGYYKEAIKLFEGKSTDDFEILKDKVEFTYRAGRIFHEWGKPDDAIGYYYATIKNGADLPHFYAANACLQLGYIFEQEGNLDKAKYYYKKSLSYKDHEYKSSLQQKAKAGLNRIDG